MKASVRVELEKAIDSFLTQICDHDDRPPIGLIYPDMVEHMADAAAAVYDATFAAALYNQQESVK